MAKNTQVRPIVGWREWAALPALGIERIKVKLDTGARTSALTHFMLNAVAARGTDSPVFYVHPEQRRRLPEILCEAPIVDERIVTSSNGEREHRYVIETLIRLGTVEWPIELTLTNRVGMSFRMLLGREAIRRRMVVDPGSSFRLSATKSGPVKAAGNGEVIVKIALLARNANLYTHKRFVEAAEARGHEIDVIDTLRVYLNVASHRPQIRYRGEILQDYDAVIPRIGASVTFFGTANLASVRDYGRLPAQRISGESPARATSCAAFSFSRERASACPSRSSPTPPSQADDILEMLGGAPVVIKLLEGTQGIGVVLGETDGSAKSMIQAFGGLKANILVQEFIKEAGNEDIRCLVVGDRSSRRWCARASRAISAPTSIAAGPRTHQDHAGRAFNGGPRRERHGAECVRCGHLRSNHGPVVMEVNSSPGLEGVEKATGIDVAAKIIGFIEKKRAAEQDQDAGEGIATPDRNALPLHPASTDFAPLTSPAVSATPRRRRSRPARARRR